MSGDELVLGASNYQDSREDHGAGEKDVGGKEARAKEKEDRCLPLLSLVPAVFFDFTSPPLPAAYYNNQQPIIPFDWQFAPTRANARILSSDIHVSTMTTPASRRNGKLASCEPCRRAKIRCDHEVRNTTARPII